MVCLARPSSSHVEDLSARTSSTCQRGNLGDSATPAVVPLLLRRGSICCQLLGLAPCPAAHFVDSSHPEAELLRPSEHCLEDCLRTGTLARPTGSAADAARFRPVSVQVVAVCGEPLVPPASQALAAPKLKLKFAKEQHACDVAAATSYISPK